MTAPTTTAATPEELATITVRYRLPRSEAQAVMLDERARQVSWDDVFAERDAQRAEIERLTAKLDACVLVKDRAFAAATAAEAALAAVTAERDASRERERKLREAGQPVADAFRKHRTAMDAINALNEVGGDTGASIDGLWREADAASEEIDRAMEQFCAALQQQAADVR